MMLRAGWTFLRLGSPIRDRPHSPKYAWRGSGGQEVERDTQKRKKKGGVVKKRETGQNWWCVRVRVRKTEAPKSDMYVAVTKNKFQYVLLFVDLMKNCRQPEAAPLEI